MSGCAVGSCSPLSDEPRGNLKTNLGDEGLSLAVPSGASVASQCSYKSIASKQSSRSFFTINWDILGINSNNNDNIDNTDKNAAYSAVPEQIVENSTSVTIATGNNNDNNNKDMEEERSHCGSVASRTSNRSNRSNRSIRSSRSNLSTTSKQHRGLIPETMQSMQAMQSLFDDSSFEGSQCSSQSGTAMPAMNITTATTAAANSLGSRPSHLESHLNRQKREDEQSNGASCSDSRASSIHSGTTVPTKNLSSAKTTKNNSSDSILFTTTNDIPSSCKHAGLATLEEEEEAVEYRVEDAYAIMEISATGSSIEMMKAPSFSASSHCSNENQSHCHNDNQQISPDVTRTESRDPANDREHLEDTEDNDGEGDEEEFTAELRKDTGNRNGVDPDGTLLTDYYSREQANDKEHRQFRALRHYPKSNQSSTNSILSGFFGT